MRSLNLPELLLLASRTQEAIRDAMNAAYGAAIVVVSMRREDPDAPLDRSILPTFEKMFARLVVPVIEAVYQEGDTNNDIRQFLIGTVRDDAIESNRGFYMARVEALIESSERAVRADRMRQNADKN